MSSPLSRLREVLQEALDAGDTQTALGKRLGVTQPTIHGWLNEDGLDPKASALGAVARVLGINGHWLLTGQGERRVLSVGADAVFAAGRQVGRREAMQAIEDLPAISAGTDALDAAVEVLRVRDDLRKAATEAPRPRRAAGGARRPRDER